MSDLLTAPGTIGVPPTTPPASPSATKPQRQRQPDPNAPDLGPGKRTTRIASVARLLGVHRSRVEQMAKKGILTPHLGKDGWRVYFDADEVERFAERYKPQQGSKTRRKPGLAKESICSAKLAARIFALLEDGADIARVVREAPTTPIIARQMWEEFRTSFEEGVANREAARVAAEQKRLNKEHEERMFKERMARLRARKSP